MLAACLLLACAIIGGATLTFLIDGTAPRSARICMGASLGLVLLASVGFVTSLWLGLGAASIGLSAAVMLSPLLLLAHAGWRRRVIAQFGSPRGARVFRPKLSYLLFYVAISVLLGGVFSRAFFERSDGIYTGIANNLGDLPLHLQIINSFAQGHNLPPQDPTYAGVRFVYPFLVDFLAAMLVRAGANVMHAMWLQNMVMALALIGSLHYWTLLLTRNRRAGFIAPLLVIFSGGLGWWLLFTDVGSNDGFFSLLAQLPHDYTIMLNPGGILRWGNSLTTLFVPQRSILFGLPLAIFIFCQWWRVVSQQEESVANRQAAGNPDKSRAASGKKLRAAARRREAAAAAVGEAGTQSSTRIRMIAAGIAAGLLPLVHAHTFLVVMASAICLALLFRAPWSEWVLFIAVALLVALPGILWLARPGGINARSYIDWQPGWDHHDHNPFLFWLANTGLFIPVLLVSLLLRRSNIGLPRRLVKFYIPFAFCFIIPNLVKLAPWVWDNIKVLFVWYMASAPLVAWLLAKWWEQKSAWRWLAPVVLATMLLAGGLDVLRVLSGVTEYREFDPPGIAIAKAISSTAAPGAVVLHAPTYNSPVFLTGRRSLLGYPGWMWSRGLDYSQRSAEIERIYSGEPNADALLRGYGVEYALVGPDELASFRVNAQFWEQHAAVALEGPYRLYKIDGEHAK